MEKDDLFVLGYAEIISDTSEEKIVNYYFDEAYNRTTKENAKHITVRKYDFSGNLVAEQYIDTNIKLLNNGTVERVYGKTPNGGDYAEAHYFDDNFKYVVKENAVNIIIRECKEDGTLIMETRAVNEKNKKRKFL